MGGGKQTQSEVRSYALIPAMTALVLAAGFSQTAQAGATFKIDDTKWVSIGAGLRTSFQAAERGAPSGNTWSNDFSLNNIRLYVNGQVHKNIKFEFNTECPQCGSGGDLTVLDAVGKFEFNSMFNLWGGRLLVPAERRELNGPFYSAVYTIFSSGTPFEPSDYNLLIKNDGTSAGSIGRDDGVVLWGAALQDKLQYSVGFFRGLRNGANQNSNILYAQRVSYNFWDVEKNPGYYTSGTYYGKGGDILTLAVANQYQEDGAGTLLDPGNFRGTTVDVLLEKVMGNSGVITANGEYKNYGIGNGYSQASRDAGGGFDMFEGNAYDFSAMYLFPQKVGIGQLQPYLRYVGVDPSTSSSRNAYEGGLNYVIDGHNARVSLSYIYGDLSSKGLNYTSGAAGSYGSTISLGLQLQI